MNSNIYNIDSTTCPKLGIVMKEKAQAAVGSKAQNMLYDLHVLLLLPRSKNRLIQDQISNDKELQTLEGFRLLILFFITIHQLYFD